MKIVILDAHAVNPGDLDWNILSSFGDLIVYPHTLPEETFDRINDAEIVLTNKTIISKEIIESCPNLKYVGVLATGYNVVDLDAATKNGIVVTNISYNLSHKLHIARHLAILDHCTEIVTENTAEIVMTGIREERTAVGQHPHERAQMPRSSQILQVSFHSDLVIKEPPRGTVLHLSSCLAALEAADQRHHLAVHLGIEVEQDRFGQAVLALKAIQQARKSADAVLVGNAVVARVKSQTLHHFGVVVTHGSQMQLGANAVFGVQPHKEIGQVALEVLRILL